MYDRQTDSLWSQFTGQPVMGPLTGSGIELKMLPVTLTSWAQWRARQPQTSVLSRDTRVSRGFGTGGAYRAHFVSPGLVVPVLVAGPRVKDNGVSLGVP